MKWFRVSANFLSAWKMFRVSHVVLSIQLSVQSNDKEIRATPINIF